MSVIEEWSFQNNIRDIDVDLFDNFAQVINIKRDNILILLDDGFKVQKCIFNGTINVNNDDELQILNEQNKQLRCDIESKIEELGRQQNKYESYKRDQKLLSQEVKETHEAFLMAKKCYKKFLRVYYSIEKRNKDKQTIFFQFFTESKKDSENYSVRLIRDSKSGYYELLSTTPKLNSLKELQRRLKETNDVPGIMCSIRQAFVVIKENKH
ncbi:uncharacterized protein LOC135074563 [Ostrinia nubilalis]|uniref:uncharacterized protein LOC135074563 n=1 Tax=Ostrinia nubilalis TaxID=29057 RepID=UPI0030823E32